MFNIENEMGRRQTTEPFKHFWMEVSPDFAEEILSNCNTHNRKISQAVVDKYATDMKNGKWKATHQGLAFDKNWTLLDGQHRLWAVIESGVTVEMAVTTGMDKETLLAIDGGRARRAQDQVYLATGKIMPEALVRQFFIAIRNTGRASAQELKAYYDEYATDFDWVTDLNQEKKCKLGGVSVQAALMVAYRHYRKQWGKLPDKQKELAALEKRLKRFWYLYVDGTHQNVQGVEDGDQTAISFSRHALARFRGKNMGYQVKMDLMKRAEFAISLFLAGKDFAKAWTEQSNHVYALPDMVS